MNREEALFILHKHTKSENHRKHAYFSRLYKEDEEKWGITGLLHDFDYEEHPTPEEHPITGIKILESMGIQEDIVKAIKGHADYLGEPRETLMAKTLYAVDELAGFVIAVALVRPSKKLAEVTVESVKKKMKDKAFARNVNREEIIKGAKELNIELDHLIENVIKALQSISDVLGL